MASAVPSANAATDPQAAAKLQFMLRFSVGTTASFIVCEWAGWQPSAFGPVLTAVLLANLPVSPPPKVGLVLVLVMGVAAWSAFFLTTLLSQAPVVLFLLLGLIMFLCFAGLAQAKGQLPLTLMLLCMAVVPVVTLTVSQFYGGLSSMLTRGMAVAVVFTWIAYAIWPLPSPKRPDPPADAMDSPVVSALLATMIVLPVMLVYLMFGLTDAMPVLVTTVLLVAKMEEERGAAGGWGKLLGNFLGGFIAVAAYYALSMAPSLITLALIVFLIGIGFAQQIVKGGVRGGNALLGYNSTMVIFGLALLKGDNNSGTWGTRVVQFAIAVTFAVAMMSLFMPRRRPALARDSH